MWNLGSLSRLVSRDLCCSKQRSLGQLPLLSRKDKEKWARDSLKGKFYFETQFMCIIPFKSPALPALLPTSTQVSSAGTSQTQLASWVQKILQLHQYSERRGTHRCERRAIIPRVFMLDLCKYAASNLCRGVFHKISRISFHTYQLQFGTMEYPNFFMNISNNCLAH